MNMRSRTAVLLPVAAIVGVIAAAATGAVSVAGSEKPAKSVVISPNSIPSIEEGSSCRLSAEARDSNGIALDPQPRIAWNSAHSAITVSSSGEVRVNSGCNGCGADIRATVTNPDGTKVFGSVHVSGKVPKR